MQTEADKISATGKRRLLKLASFLAKLPASKRFRMRYFAERIEDGKPACGTAACAAGWGACIPSFRRAGYRLARRRVESGSYLTVTYDRKSDFAALQSFFDLSAFDAQVLFDTWNPAASEWNPDSAKEAAKRIRALVKARA